MNLSKHMEAVFISCTALLCATVYQAPAPLPQAQVVQQDAAAEAQSPVQTVVITGRRSAA